MPWLGWILVWCSGLGLVGAFPPYNQDWLAWIDLIPVWLAFRCSGELRQHAFLAGYALGLLYFGGVFWWISYTTVAGTLALVAYLSLYPAIWCWFVVNRMPLEVPLRSFPNIRYAAAGASAWVALEWWRGWFLTGFGWNPLGVSQHNNLPFVQLAGLGGVFLISWLIVFVNLIGGLTLERFYREIRREQRLRPHFDFSVAMVLVSLSFAYGLHHIWKAHPGPERTLRYACIQANIPQSVKNERVDLGDILRRHVVLTEQAEALQPDLMLWPETATGQNLFLDPDLHDAVFDISRTHSFYFLLGAQDAGPGKIYNAAFFLSPGGEDVQVYRKNHLVIFGEYTPLADYLPFLRWLVPFSMDFSTGNGPELFVIPSRQVKMAPLICFEDTLPRYVRQVAALKPDILVNITNDGWFQQSPGAEQHLANAIFRTVELDVPLLRCANTGITAEITRFGAVRSVLANEHGDEVEVAGILSGELMWRPSETTVYERYGDWIVLISAADVAIFSALRLRAKPASRL